MAEAPRIPRKTSTPEEGSFDALRAEGIRVLARHSGETWTDYNLHDPGITILEQLCYGLTDLIYRAGFDVADHLTGPDGTIDFARQALHLPMDILPSRPTTAADLRERLLDEIEGLEDAWILPAGDASAAGLHVLVLRETAAIAALEQAERGPARAALSAQALRVFLESRTLCEDLAGEPVVAEGMRYRLIANLEIAGPRPPAEILDDVYTVVEAHVAGRPVPDSAARRLEDGATLDELLTGPCNRAGVSLNRDRGYSPEYVFLPDVVARVRAVRGVAAVHDLTLEPVGGRTPAPAAPKPATSTAESAAKPKPLDAVSRLVREEGERGTTRWLVPVLDDPPASSDPARVRLWKDGRPVAEPPEFSARFREASLKRRRLKRPYESWGAIYTAPTGQYRDLGEYHSIQEHFPSIYGVGSRGLPAASTPQERSSARQLKAYLLLLEQVMANYVANLHGVRDLFSWERPLGPTYAFQALDQKLIPGFAQAYAVKSAQDGTLTGPGGPYVKAPDAHLTVVRDEFDDHVERRGRLFDHMLAMFGESHDQSSLARFGRPDGRRDVEAWVVENKARFLREIQRVTRDRVGARDYSRPAANGAADDADALRTHAEAEGFALRLGLLLGITDHRPRPLAGAQPAVSEGFHVLEHVLLRPSGGGRAHAGAKASGANDALHPDRLWADFYPSRMTVVLPAQAGRFRIPAFRLLVEETVRVNAPAHVLADCIWLDAPSLQRFEKLLGRFERLYGSRLQGLARPGDAAPGGSPAELDSAAQALIAFLVEAHTARERTRAPEVADAS